AHFLLALSPKVLPSKTQVHNVRSAPRTSNGSTASTSSIPASTDSHPQSTASTSIIPASTDSLPPSTTSLPSSTAIFPPASAANLRASTTSLRGTSRFPGTTGTTWQGRTGKATIPRGTAAGSTRASNPSKTTNPSTSTAVLPLGKRDLSPSTISLRVSTTNLPARATSLLAGHIRVRGSGASLRAKEVARVGDEKSGIKVTREEGGRAWSLRGALEHERTIVRRLQNYCFGF
ncbi:hypothetical protein F5882DRAFT_504486, partial [Hyaloscypha sp. PMI_1271]